MSKKDTIILGIESSCDDTSAAILINDRIVTNIIANQEVHKKYGGVVPELASRAHQQDIIPVVDTALKQANLTVNDLDAIAFTRGPGLLGSLIVGTSFAKSLALALDIPLVEVNHMQGHILAHFIEDEQQSPPQFPFICLTVSGGHTQLVVVNDYLDMEVVGTTRDDAAGEAFDKIAKLLGFPYPGGPLIDQHAKLGTANVFSFTKPKLPDFEYSFSGLKTNVLQFLNRESKTNSNFLTENLNDICASLQATILDILFEKLIRASQHFNIREIAIAGGVSANSGLRQRLVEEGKKRNWNTYIPKFEYCTDNAAMIAIAGKYNLLAGNIADQTIAPLARLKM